MQNGIQKGQYRILLIKHDNLATRALLTSLYQAGIECHLALGVRDGIAIARATAPQMVLVDIPSPDDACGIGEAIREVTSAPVIMLTDNEDADSLPGFGTTFDDYILKPPTLRQMVLRVLRSLRKLPTTMTVA
jgi:DNA-binding response OmpR family regulator